uniref:NADH-ubiquinone oxidoreductase chain 4 n=1 Tax=Aphrocallistes vastus TaxID=83887 RepID=B2BRP9_APHVA|nr:NADH dehydrogenase subunit 4 [Aphrocallistes vastus]ABR58843.1 NADH dehydrogenase subunit 4 [Aphrocallistes vastus]
MELLKILFNTCRTILILILLPNHLTKLQKNISRIRIIITLRQTILLYFNTFNINQHISLKLENTNLYIHNITIDYISTYLLLLTTILILCCIFLRKTTIYHSNKKLLLCLMIIRTILFSAFTTTNLLIFYILFESSIIPLIIIIGIWGSRKEKIRAIYYFLIYTIIGSLPLFLSILTIKNQLNTFNITTIQKERLERKRQIWLFSGLFLAFAIKTPLIPWHTWLPLAHVEAPATGSVLLAGILLKLGAYGFIRFTIPILPNTSKFLSPLIIILRILSLWSARLNSLRQNDIKRIIAYSSIAHMGIITAAIFSQNTIRKNGSLLLIIRHGLRRPALFILTSLLYERHKTRLIKNHQGTRLTTPILSTLTIIVRLAHMRTPGSINFIGEYMCLLGLWELHPTITLIRIIGILITTAYLLLLYIQTRRRKPQIYTNYKTHELSQNEIHRLLSLITPNILLGIIPYPILIKINIA